MSVQAGLTYLCSFNVCTFGAEFSTLFVEKEQKGYVIVVVAVASFLAGTRNLMFIGCRTLSFIVGICACIEIRSLVLARDDGVVGTCSVLWVFTFIFRHKNIRTKDSFKGRMYIQASLMFIYSLNVCTCGAVSMTAFVMKNRMGG